MSNETSNQNNANDPWSMHLKEWHARLRNSAALLAQNSLKIQEILNDEHRFAMLTELEHPKNLEDSYNKAVDAEMMAFDRLLVESLTALIDLTGHDNPDREYPDLKNDFKFECSNVNYGKSNCYIYGFSKNSISGMIFKILVKLHIKPSFIFKIKRIYREIRS